MKQQGNFILMDRYEFKEWLGKQKVTRKITTLQTHHTWSPNYGHFKNDHFIRLEGMRSSHLKRGFIDIAQQFTTFPDGKIGVSLGRGLNIAPAGIKGCNSNGICIEHIGNFDKNGDSINPEQKQTILYMYAVMCDKFNLPVNTNSITYHCWWTEDGKYLGDYFPNKSAKTCPGTAWWGDGNSIVAANKGFIPAIQAELKRLKEPVATISPVPQNTVKDDDQVDKVKDILTKDNSVYEGFMKDSTNYVSVEVLTALGHKVSWDNNTKKLYIS